MGLKSFREQQRESIEETKRGRKFWKNRTKNLPPLQGRETTGTVSGTLRSSIALEKPGRVI
jgi:hypothetical protein